MREQIAAPAPVSVEVFLLRVNVEGGWAYRRLVTLPAEGESPDEAARRLSGVAGDAPSTVVHSTSWRYLPEGQIVLTYVICPDPAPQSTAVDLPDLRLARGSGPAAPSPRALGVENVVSHAIRHLAFLLGTDPAARDALGRFPAVTAALEDLSPALAGELLLRPAVAG